MKSKVLIWCNTHRTLRKSAVFIATSGVEKNREKKGSIHTVERRVIECGKNPPKVKDRSFTAPVG